MTEPSARVVVQSQIKNSFNMFDTEGKGFIQIKFFGTLMRSLGFNITEDLAYEVAAKVDTEKSEVINFDQFRKYFWNIINSEQTKKDFQLAFNIIDVDKDGFVSYEDLKIFLQSLGEQRSSEQIKQMMQDADVDGDEHISYEEFVRLMITR